MGSDTGVVAGGPLQTSSGVELESVCGKRESWDDLGDIMTPTKRETYARALLQVASGGL